LVEALGQSIDLGFQLPDLGIPRIRPPPVHRAMPVMPMCRYGKSRRS
jgi:hypothetical protein